LLFFLFPSPPCGRRCLQALSFFLHKTKERTQDAAPFFSFFFPPFPPVDQRKGDPLSCFFFFLLFFRRQADENFEKQLLCLLSVLSVLLFFFPFLSSHHRRAGEGGPPDPPLFFFRASAALSGGRVRSSSLFNGLRSGMVVSLFFSSSWTKGQALVSVRADQYQITFAARFFVFFFYVPSKGRRVLFFFPFSLLSLPGEGTYFPPLFSREKALFCPSFFPFFPPLLLRGFKRMLGTQIFDSYFSFSPPPQGPRLGGGTQLLPPLFFHDQDNVTFNFCFPLPLPLFFFLSPHRGSA